MAGAKAFPAVSLAEADAALTRPGSPFEIEERTIRGVRTRVWKNAPPTLRDAFLLGRAYGERTFVVYRDERASYRGVRARRARRRRGAAGGRRRQGRPRRHRHAQPAGMAGRLLRLPARRRRRHSAQCLVDRAGAANTASLDSGAKVAIVDRERLERLAEHLHNCPNLKRVFVSRERDEVAHPKVAKLEDVDRRGRTPGQRLPDRPLPDVAIDPDDDATIFYTSGTTGKPKGALGTHRNA